MGECFFWYRPTRVVPDQRLLNGRCCRCCIEKRFLWHEADYDGMNLYPYEVDWYGMLSVNLCPNDLWLALRDKI